MINNNIIFITNRIAYEKGIIGEGYQVFHPYRGKGLLMRVLREIWFRLHLPERVWYSQDLRISNPQFIIVQDPLITRNYIEWLIGMFPKADIHFMYCNLVGKAKHIYPDEIPDEVVVWTYDRNDKEKYNLNLSSGGGYATSFIGEKQEIVYDVFFVGRDKGRGEYLLELKTRMEDLGLETKFIITRDGRFARKKPYYSQEISYEEVIKLDNQSKAILNIIMPGQVGATMRDFEALYNGVKLITNNSNIKSFDFYKKENIFILEEDDWNKLPEFLNSSIETIEANILEKHSFKSFVEEITGMKS